MDLNSGGILNSLHVASTLFKNAKVTKENKTLNLMTGIWSFPFQVGGLGLNSNFNVDRIMAIRAYRKN